MKILIIGSVGSGKTTLSRCLSKKYSCNCYEIDSIVHDDKNGVKRTVFEQESMIKEIDRKKDWIIEGTLRENLYFLLDIAEEIIFIDISIVIINFRILKRFIKQKLKIEKCNYKPTYNMLKLMYRWSSDFHNKRKQFKSNLNRYENKVIVIENNKDLLKLL